MTTVCAVTTAALAVAKADMAESHVALAWGVKLSQQSFELVSRYDLRVVYFTGVVG